MDQDFERKIMGFIEANSVDCELHVFNESCHSVAEACQATSATPEDFIKSVCLVSGDGLIVAIVRGCDKVSFEKVSLASNSDVRLATSEEVLCLSGYPAGGVPPFGYNALFFIDEKVLERELVWAGGGSTRALIRVRPREIARISNCTISGIRR